MLRKMERWLYAQLRLAMNTVVTTAHSDPDNNRCLCFHSSKASFEWYPSIDQISAELAARAVPTMQSKVALHKRRWRLGLANSFSHIQTCPTPTLLLQHRLNRLCISKGFIWTDHIPISVVQVSSVKLGSFSPFVIRIFLFSKEKLIKC